MYRSFCISFVAKDCSWETAEIHKKDVGLLLSVEKLKTKYDTYIYNCKNVKTSVRDILELCKTNDITLVEETWLADFAIAFLSRISDDFYATGTSAMNTTDKLYKSRPFEGLVLCGENPCQI